MGKPYPPLRTVDSLDLQRYAGKWFEIARLPNRFEDDCAADVTATYTLLDCGRVEVVNACRNDSGRVKKAKGVARPATRNGPASRLKVAFAPALLRILPFVWADYWVIDLDADYQVAAVGEPSRRYFWILARNPQIDDAAFAGIVSRAEGQCYDLSRLIRPRQTGG